MSNTAIECRHFFSVCATSVCLMMSAWFNLASLVLPSHQPTAAGVTGESPEQAGAGHKMAAATQTNDTGGPPTAPAARHVTAHRNKQITGTDRKMKEEAGGAAVPAVAHWVAAGTDYMTRDEAAAVRRHKESCSDIMNECEQAAARRADSPKRDTATENEPPEPAAQTKTCVECVASLDRQGYFSLCHRCGDKICRACLKAQEDKEQVLEDKFEESAECVVSAGRQEYFALCRRCGDIICQACLRAQEVKQQMFKNKLEERMQSRCQEMLAALPLAADDSEEMTQEEEADAQRLRQHFTDILHELQREEKRLKESRHKQLPASAGSDNRDGVPEALARTFGHPGDRTQRCTMEAPRNGHKRCLCQERETRQERRRTDGARHGVEEALTSALGEPIAAGVEDALCEHEQCSRACGWT